MRSEAVIASNEAVARTFEKEVDVVPRFHTAQQPRDLRAIRATGCPVSYDTVDSGAGMVAVQVSAPIDETPLGVGIGGPGALIRFNAACHGALLRDAVRRFRAPARTAVAVRAQRTECGLGAAA